uniref:Uncharacterized protein n=1 Tax=Chromera velia CCMP2878 TaxID=1169474 RepID=A0A0G4HVV2_9ALVE|eukprot:Cvel_1399.t1-p1 / transcript=Cvel_1399.t1 / gene=Cvel_1399 / organism=Chromera_velia_CCMP2878 / gene_product=Ankyrin repeat domain-containing protein 62, putative / transcript_product=Ankyrin repeat domain-containing protein 62, putative / location=Cvel_scaffold49:74-1867(-) / protein_length=598 / sequence_SO=supercontig / SO=protein_coding / is_pseudo=false
MRKRVEHITTIAMDVLMDPARLSFLSNEELELLVKRAEQEEKVRKILSNIRCLWVQKHWERVLQALTEHRDVFAKDPHLLTTDSNTPFLSVLISQLPDPFPFPDHPLYQLADLLVELTDPNQKEPSEGKTPFMQACESGTLRLVHALWSRGGRWDVTDSFGRHAGFRAVGEQTSTAVLLFLIAHGMPLELRDNQGRTLMHMSADKGGETTTRLLHHLGADIAARDNEGVLPQHLAAAKKTVPAVVFFVTTENYCVRQGPVRKRLSVMSVNDKGETVLDLMRGGGGIDDLRYAIWLLQLEREGAGGEDFPGQALMAGVVAAAAHGALRLWALTSHFARRALLSLSPAAARFVGKKHEGGEAGASTGEGEGSWGDEESGFRPVHLSSAGGRDGREGGQDTAGEVWEGHSLLPSTGGGAPGGDGKGGRSGQQTQNRSLSSLCASTSTAASASAPCRPQSVVTQTQTGAEDAAGGALEGGDENEEEEDSEKQYEEMEKPAVSAKIRRRDKASPFYEMMLNITQPVGFTAEGLLKPWYIERGTFWSVSLLGFLVSAFCVFPVSSAPHPFLTVVSAFLWPLVAGLYAYISCWNPHVMPPRSRER